MNEEEFINRRGHRQVLDTQARETTDAQSQAANERQQRASRQKIRVSSRARKALLLGFAVIVIVPLLLGEYVRMSYDNDVSSTRSRVAEYVTKTLLPMQEQASLSAEDLRAVADKVGSFRDALCAGGVLDNLAKLYPRAQDAYSKCNEYREKLTVASEATRELSSQIKYIDQLQAVFGNVARPDGEQFAVIPSQQDNWKQLADNVTSIGSPTSFLEAHSKLVKAVKAVSDGWTSLNAAFNAQDPTAFTAAESRLKAKYDALKQLKKDFSSAVATTQTRLDAIRSLL